MTDQNGTTTAPSRATTTSWKSKPKRRNVQHYFWVKTIEAANAMGVYMRSLCGVWESPSGDPPDNIVEVVGGMMPLPEIADCRRCLRVLEAYHRRAAEAKP